MTEKAKTKAKRKPTASERISALEEAYIEANDKIVALAGIIDENKGMTIDLVDKLDQKVISVAKRINATVVATDSKDSVEKIIQENSAKELENSVNVLIKNKVLIDDIDGSIVEQSFVVGRHISNDGTEITPRLQFYTGSLADEEKKLFLGKKVGDLVPSDDNKVSVEITELFLVQTPDKEVKKEEETPLLTENKKESPEESKTV